MSDTEGKSVAALCNEGRYDEALFQLLQAFASAERAVAPTRSDLFLTMFEWHWLADECDYAPARAAMARVRNAQIKHLLAGDIFFGRDNGSANPDRLYRRIRRYDLIVEMNETLKDVRSTYGLFATLHARQPELARRYAWSALPCIVEVGDFALAAQYCGDPLAALDEVNETARTLPLYPTPPTAPRLSSKLSNLVRDVRIGMAVSRGLGKDAEADALREALLTGLESAELEALARRELDEPGTITREIVQRQMEQDNL